MSSRLLAKCLLKFLAPSHWNKHLINLSIHQKFISWKYLAQDCFRFLFWSIFRSTLFYAESRCCYLPTPLNLQGWKNDTAPKYKLCYSPLPVTSKQMSDCCKILLEAQLSSPPHHGWDHECSLWCGNIVSSSDNHAQSVNNF